MVGIDGVDALRQAIEKHALTRGEFPLVAGSKSDYYLRLRTLTQHPTYAEIIGELLAPAIIEAGAEGVGGMAIGALPISDAVGAAARRGGFILPGFSVRYKPKDHGSKLESEVSAAIADDGSVLLSEARRVAVVEDTVTTGGSAWRACEVVWELGCQVVIVYTVVERHERGGDRFRELGIPFRRLFYTDKDGRVFLDEVLVGDLT